MWELAKTPSHGGNSVRSIFSFVLTAVLAALLLVLFSAPALHAVDDKVTFNDGGLTYQGNQYADAGKATAGNSASIPDGSEYYTFVEPVNPNNAAPQTDVIYFAANKTPQNESSATFVEYDTNPSNSPPTYSNAHNQKTVSVTPSTTAPVVNGCSVASIGWIVCPVSDFIASAMDWLIGVLSTFVIVQPLNVTDTHNDIYVAWNAIRSIANVAFIIVFLIIIYSQLTSTAVSNYGLKKLLPRLIVAVLIVNLSYVICAIILDASNILGMSIQGLFSGIRDTVGHTDGTSVISTSQGQWQNVVSASLAGTSVAAGAVIGGVVLNTAILGAAGGGLIYLLLPILLALVLSVLVVILILAVRQALIILLIIISPLAFVAYLLPNTEKWFASWRKLFSTMMVFFPAFSAVFGAAELAGTVIVKNAVASGSMTLIVLGMAVQFAPLAITPILLRLSGSTVQGIAKYAQNFNKRISGSVGGWAKVRREMLRDESLARTDTKNPFRKSAQYWNARGQRVRERSEIAQQGVKNMYNGYGATRRNPQKWHEGLDIKRRQTEERKELLARADDKRWYNYANTNPEAIREDIELQQLTEQVAAGKSTLETTRKIRKTANYQKTAEYLGMSQSMRSMIDDTQRATEQIATQGMRGAIAERARVQDFAKALKASAELRDIAGAVEIDEKGAESALASAINSVNEAYSKAVAEAKTLFSNFNILSRDKQAFAMGERSVSGVDDDGNNYTFRLDDTYSRDAAVEDQVAAGGVADVEALVMASGNTLRDYRKTISDGILKNASLRDKALYLSGETLDDINAGNIRSEEDLKVVITRAIANGKISEELLAKQDPTSAQRLATAAESPVTTGSHPGLFVRNAEVLPDRIQELSETARGALTGDKSSTILGASRDALEDIGRIGDPTFSADDDDSSQS